MSEAASIVKAMHKAEQALPGMVEKLKDLFDDEETLPKDRIAIFHAFAKTAVTDKRLEDHLGIRRDQKVTNNVLMLAVGEDVDLKKMTQDERTAWFAQNFLKKNGNPPKRLEAEVT